jgi:signal transduction histidine kinase
MSSVEERRERPPLYGARTWREVAHLLSNLPVGIIGFTFTVVVITAGIGMAVTVVGLPLLAAGLTGCRAFGAFERGRARLLLDEEIPEPPPVRPRRGGAAFLGWLASAIGDGPSWRSALYLVLMLPWGIITFTVGLVSVVALWPLMPWIVHALAAVHRAMASALLSPSELKARVEELEEDRGTVVDSAAADLRRIERDLHDGAQARLVSLAMDLGLAKEKLLEDGGDTAAVAGMVDAAHGEVKLALQELRDLARGIHPAVLTDRGLDAALSSVAARCAVPEGVRVTTDLPDGPDGPARPDSAVEGIAYFTVSELLTNTAKHAGARSAQVDAWRTEDRLMLQVRDNGRGGARETPGGGLAGLADRIRAVDGVFVVDSPEGGPTTITVELPWRTRARGARGGER